MTDVPLPAPGLFAHELITNGGGIYLGCNSRSICEQAHTPGETSEEISEFYTAEQLRSYGDARVAAALKDLGDPASPSGSPSQAPPIPIAACLDPTVTPPCSAHPDAPHGFDRNSSHSLDRYVCDCEGRVPPKEMP
jgi:hypothetical protein